MLVYVYIHTLYIHICMYICMHSCIFIYVCIYLCMYKIDNVCENYGYTYRFRVYMPHTGLKGRRSEGVKKDVPCRCPAASENY